MANPKPVAEVRIGRVKAAIWPNKTEGRTRHNVTFSRLYKDGDEMEEDAELWSQRPVGAGESGRSGPLAHLRASAGRTAGGGVLVCGRHRRAAGPVPAALRTFTSEPDTF